MRNLKRKKNFQTILISLSLYIGEEKKTNIKTLVPMKTKLCIFFVQNDSHKFCSHRLELSDLFEFGFDLIHLYSILVFGSSSTKCTCKYIYRKWNRNFWTTITTTDRNLFTKTLFMFTTLQIPIVGHKHEQFFLQNICNGRVASVCSKPNQNANKKIFID